MALAGLLLAIAGPFVYMALLWHAFSRSTGWPAFVLIVLGCVLAVAAALQDPRWRVRILAGAAVAWGGLFAVGFFVLAALPTGHTLAEGEPAPSFTLADTGGQAVSLADVRISGPVLLVFYRGHW